MIKGKSRTILSTGLLLGLSFSVAAHVSESEQHAEEQRHAEHSNDPKHLKPEPIGNTAKLVTGQGEFIFSWDEELTAAFPKDARQFESEMHGGFTEDPETGIVYTGIPGYGLASISSNLKRWETIGADPRLKDNIHGLVFFVHNDIKYLALAQEGKRVLVLTLDGNIVSEIVKPSGNEFEFIPANEFFGSETSDFGVTDVTYLDGTLYVAHGYSAGDFILTIVENKGLWSWGSLAWGGRGDNPDQFKIAHGLYAHDNHILVANRIAGKIVKFTKDGEFVETFDDIPAGSLVCNISYNNEHYFLNALSPLGEQKSAPIYVHTGKTLVSTIIPGDLNIPALTNIHQVWPHYVQTDSGDKDLYLLVHGWNKGKFAVLRME
jgi:hypothetical protein